MIDVDGSDRRRFLKLAGAGIAGLAAGLRTTPARPAQPTSGATAADAEIVLEAAPDRVAILDGPETEVLRFSARVERGDPSLLTRCDSYLGPTLEIERGQRLEIELRNRIADPTIVHWHGLHVPFAADGHPTQVVPGGGSYRYDFTVRNRAGLYWYHPHPHQHTGEQVYFGLAGLLVVRDPEEAALGLPSGAQELSLAIQDRRFDDTNRLRYIGSGMERMTGFLGDRILVNGRPDARFEVAAAPLRLRLLNGSSSRIYKLGWSDGRPMAVIGNDGGLLAAPVTKPYVTLAPAERVDLWVDLSDRRVGTSLDLESLGFSAATAMGMGRGRGGGRGGRGRGRGGMVAGTLANGEPFRILRLVASREADHHERKSLPGRLTPLPDPPVDEALADGPAIPLRLAMGHMAATINGRSFEMRATAPEERVAVGTSRVFVLDNPADAMMAMAHPMHFHGQQFQVVRREPGPGIDRGYDSLREGLVDEGLKDTTLVFPGERVTIVKRFDDYAGLFLYHCHILEHEDLGMMRNLEVSA
ncbi:MAG: multicopper oxidase domain-containing protein [Thermoanaerobaculia bacterium]|nr:multicopper oxidase domain-containing protein [Thermoanaerobaculia bacterium]